MSKVILTLYFPLHKIAFEMMGKNFLIELSFLTSDQTYNLVKCCSLSTP